MPHDTPFPLSSTPTTPTTTPPSGVPDGGEEEASQKSIFQQRNLNGATLSRTVDKYLAQYFETLGGMTPPPHLHSIVLEQVEKPLISHVLHYVGGNQLRAADILGINRNTLRKKISKLGIYPHKIKADKGQGAGRVEKL